MLFATTLSPHHTTITLLDGLTADNSLGRLRAALHF
jgi:hypothetical protein